MRHLKKLTENQKIRFGIVGISNTLLNFAVLNFAFYFLKTNKIVSSIIATICAVSISFFLNRNFVFKHKGRSIIQPVLFVAVTLSGVLVMQNSIYALFVFILRDHSFWLIKSVHSVSGITLTDDFVDINLSNLIASLFAMVWNYNGYRWFVFKTSTLNEANESTT
jgi:putative flippase GtrA